MISNTKTIEYTKYILTFLATCVVILIMCFCIQFELLIRCENNVNTIELNVENLAKFATIEQLEKYLTNNPTNYMACVRLAKIYESLDENKKANELYSDALRISGRTNYTLFNYALFSAKMGKYDLASALAEEMSGNNSKVINYKMQIYEKIADSAVKNMHPMYANKAYQIAYKYAKNVKNTNDLQRVKDKYANSYISLANYNVKNKKIAEAISNLKNAINLNESPVAKYKLSLIYLPDNKARSELLMYDAFENDAFLVNPYIYNSLITGLINNSNEINDKSALKYYKVKYAKFKNKLSEIYLYKNDILIENIKLTNNKKFLSGKNNYVLSFDIKNNTHHKITNLYLDIDMFLNSKHITISKKPVHTGASILAGEFINYSINLDNDEYLINVKDKNTLTLNFYGRKKQKAPKTLVKIESINF